MATEKESPCQNYCANDPNFAIICSFFDRFALTCGITCPTFAELQEMIENTQDVPPELVDLHVKLLRKIRRSVAAEKWERALIKFCHSYLCSEEGWELERCGYKKCKVPVRLKILKTLLDAQFDLNSKFKNDINKLTPEELRLEPLGKDKVGQSYWCQFDSAANVRVYKEDQEEETWALVAKDHEGLVGLITQLSSGEELLGLELINEDSNSQEVEKPIIDTGQVEPSTSEENTVDSVASKNENLVKEDDSSTNDVSRNGVSSNGNSQKEILEDKISSEIKKENVEMKAEQESNNCLLPSNGSHDEVYNATNGGKCPKYSPESEQTSIGGSPLDLKNDISEKADEKSNELISAKKTENEFVNVSSILPVSEQSRISSGEVIEEIKNVAEEIKQRSLFKSNSSTLFKGKIGKSSSGSKLDQIFSRKLEQSNSLTTNKDPDKVNSQENKIITDDDSCSQTSLLSNEQECDSLSDERVIKRKTIELPDQPNKRLCVEAEPDSELEPEVGEEIEEPVMIIKGEGSGQDCDTGNPGKDNEEGVTSENMNNASSNKIDITLSSAPNENSSKEASEVISLKSGLNNGIPNDNCKVNEAILHKDIGCIKNCVDLSKKEDSVCNIRAMDDEKNPLCSAITTNEETENTEIEKSIEEQLSDLTGEGLSPKSNAECQQKIEETNENVTVFANKNVDKCIRRKSLDSTDHVDNESIPPEAKKTKVQKDCNDIFGTDDSMPYSSEENKLLDKRIDLRKNSSDMNVPKDVNEQDVGEKTKPSSSELINKNTEHLCSDTITQTATENETSKNKNLSIKYQNENDIKVDPVEESASIEEETVKDFTVLNADKVSVSNDSVEETTKASNKSELKENSISKDGGSNYNKLEAVVKGDADKISTLPEGEKAELNLDVEDLIKSGNKKRSGSSEQNLDDIDTSIKISENNESECPEKKKKTVSYVEKTPPEDKKNGSEESILHHKDEKLGVCDKNGEKSDSSVKDESKETTTKKKLPLKKSPKPRRKVFTPKSRKRTNKNRDIKAENINDSSFLEGDKNNSKKLMEETVPNSQLETKKEGDSTSDNKERNKSPEAKPIPIAGRKRRNSRKNTNTEKESEEDVASDKKENTGVEDEEIGGKRRKVKGKRAPNKTLRKSIEDKRNCKSSSEEENHSDANVEKETKKSPKESKKTVASKKISPTKSSKVTKSNQGKAKTCIKSPPKSKKDDASKIKKEDSKVEEKSDESSEKKSKKSKAQGRNSRAFLGINLDIDLSDTSRSVRQSSRLAQIKIKEQADNKHGEEIHQNMEKSGKKKKKKKDDNEEVLKGTPKRKKRTKKVSEDEAPEEEPLSERKKRKKKKKHPVKAFNERDPWKSSSGSSSDAEEEDEDHFDDIVEEEDDLPLTIKSDHEFSPESDLEADEEWKPVRRARTAQKVKEPTEEAEESAKDLDDFACEKCGKKDHPEWILLCDTCNHGWHALCLRPSLMLVPEGDWHCPPCQHTMLVKSLQETLKIYDRDTKRRENEELRRKRLAYVGISLDNVLPSNVHLPRERPSASESSESSESGSESESEFSDEPVYQLRQRRTAPTSYRFNEYDELINSAIRDEVEGSGTVLQFPVTSSEGPAVVKIGEEKPQTNENGVEVNGEESQINIVPDAKENPEKTKKKSKEESDEESSDEDENSKNEDEEEEEFPRVVPKRTTLPRPGRKKHRKLNSLDDASDDDDDDEDFKGSSSEEEEEDEEEEDSDESGAGRRRSRRGNMEPVRRSSRARKSRFDKEFINDDSEESDAPRRKKTKKLWSESDSESDDSTWGRRKKKKNYGSSRGRKFKKSKKFTIEDEQSDVESSKIPKKKRQRKIKYGGLDDLAVEELPARRTRGKKINYQEVLGSDSDVDIQKCKTFKKAIIEDDDEFDAEKEKEESAASSGEEETENEGQSSEDEDGDDDERKEIRPQNNDIQNKENENIQKKGENEEIKTQHEKVDTSPIKESPLKVIPFKVSPSKVVNKDKPPARRGRPPKAMIAPPPERLITEDEQYKAVVSKVVTLGHTMGDVGGAKAVNVSEFPQKFSETKDFMEPPQPVTPVKIPNSSFDPKMVKRSPPIKIRSGVPVNAGAKSPSLGSPTSETSLFSVKSPNSTPLHSPPDKSQLQMQRNIMSQQSITARKSINPPLINVKTESIVNEEDDLDEEDLMEEVEEEEEEEDDEEYDDSDDDVLEEGEIPKKVARRMARMEERMERLEKKRLAKQVEKLKSVQAGAVTIQPVSPGATQTPASTPEQAPTPTTQPTQPLLRVVSPLKLMANPPGPLQSTFINPGLNPRMPIGSPPSARMPMSMRPPQPTNILPGVEGSTRRGRGRGKKQEKEEMMVGTGGSVIRGMLQQPQSYPPSHYQPQNPPSHYRIPFNPQQRMPRPPFHPGHPHPMDPSPSGGGPISVKQEPGAHSTSNPVHIPNKPPASSAPPYHTQHRFDSRPPGYPPQSNPRPQYGSYPPPPVSSSGYHYGSYPPQPSMAGPPSREDYPPQQQYNEHFNEQTAAPPISKSFSEEEGSGEFGGLVSYFSSQREEDIDT